MADEGRQKRRLILLSFLMLFVELALIRWTGSNVLYLSFVTNFVLLGSFLGIGIGFLRARARMNLFDWAPVLLFLFVAFVLAFRVEISQTDLIFFETDEPTGLPIWVMLPAVFVAVAAVMAAIGEGVARTFARFEALEAYRLDIIGSLLGIGAFSALSFVGAPPVIWGTVAGVLLLALVDRGWLPLRIVAVGGMILLLLQESTVLDAQWSPYYKIRVATTASGEHHVSVNGLSHQVVMSTERRRVLEPVYFLPWEHLRGRDVQDVLVIGAGSGGDVAIALENGAERIDAVEIDPILLQIGVERNPDRPYDDPRVRRHVDDGRAFLERGGPTYDLVLFALPDSLTLVSGQSSLRLESYLFTREALRAARERLEADGVFAMYNYYREEWLVDRLAALLAAEFDHPPCVDRVGAATGIAALTVSVRGDLDCVTTPPRDAADISDDRPFLYLREPGVPPLYLLTIVLIFATAATAVRIGSGRGLTSLAAYGDLFLMGAAFLLLETKSIVQFSLLFGATWLVNAIVFAAVLLAVLVAVEITRRNRAPSDRVLIGLLLVFLLAGWAILPGQLLGLPFLLRLATSAALWFTPILLANILFASRFRQASDPTAAFGANLLGAMIGGLIEYAALVTGYQNLALVVAVLYAGAVGSRILVRRAPVAASGGVTQARRGRTRPAR